MSRTTIEVKIIIFCDICYCLFNDVILKLYTVQVINLFCEKKTFYDLVGLQVNLMNKVCCGCHMT